MYLTLECSTLGSSFHDRKHNPDKMASSMCMMSNNDVGIYAVIIKTITGLRRRVANIGPSRTHKILIGGKLQL